MPTANRPALALAALSLILTLAFGSSDARAEDIDIYSATGSSASAPTVLFILDNAANFSASAANCTYSDGRTAPSLNGMVAGVQQCALVKAIEDLDSGSAINVGIMGFNDNQFKGSPYNCGDGKNGGCLLWPIQQLNATSKAALIAWIKEWQVTGNSQYNIKANGEMTGNVMQEAWAYLAGKVGLSTRDYKALPRPQSAGTCHNDAIVFIGNAYNTSGSPGESGNADPAAALAAAPNSTGLTGQISLTGAVTACGTLRNYNHAQGYWADEWSLYLYQRGLAGDGNERVATYTVGVLDTSKCTPDYPALLASMANVGGGRYFPTTNYQELVDALKAAFKAVLGVNSSLGAAALPVSSTNRTQYLNEVYLPVFRPDSNGLPRWLGNLKQFQVIESGDSIVLGDSAGKAAVDPDSGFLTECSVSHWTSTPSSTSSAWYDYWQRVAITPPPQSKCGTAALHPYAESPDGPFVEKGGVAEVIRNGNNPPTTSGSPTMLVNRTLHTAPLSSNSLATFDAANSSLLNSIAGTSTPNAAQTTQATSVINFIRGLDVNAEYLGRDANGNTRTAAATPSPAYTRPSLHGDVLHAQAVAVDYGGATGVKVFYGANDGIFRAVDGATGKELWGFVAPEHWAKLARLKENSPVIQYSGMSSGSPRDYFFDGSIGLYQNADNSKVWIYPSMRRGGRMIYAFDVTEPTSPAIKWKAGCPNAANDTDCTGGLAGIGQTWSAPAVAARVQGYDKPVVIVGGGYDACEDADAVSPACTNRKGAVVYVLDAAGQNGNPSIVKTLALPSLPSGAANGSVAATVALIATEDGGLVNHAYVVDTRGNIYRIDFGARGETNTDHWAIHRVAYTNGSHRKFLYAPALLQAGARQVYLALVSGDREHPLRTQYPYTNPVTNRFYVFRDDLSLTNAAINLDDTSLMSDRTNCATTDCTAPILPSSALKGWFMNLNQNGTGEQGVTTTVIAGGLATFSTNRPLPPSSTSCTASLGEARGYWIDLFTGAGQLPGGASSDIFPTGGLPPSPIVGTVTVNNKPRTVVIGAIPLQDPGTKSPIGATRFEVSPAPTRKLRYWHGSRDY